MFKVSRNTNYNEIIRFIRSTLLTKLKILRKFIFVFLYNIQDIIILYIHINLLVYFAYAIL